MFFHRFPTRREEEDTRKNIILRRIGDWLERTIQPKASKKLVK
jgi:hypothetical protein